jgi:flagellar biosynthesis chaperone FliJ
MRNLFRIAFIVLLFCCCVSITAAITVSEDKVPGKNLQSGERVEVILKLFIESDYPLNRDVWIASDLTDNRVTVFDITDSSIPPLPVQVNYETNPLIKAWILLGFIIRGSESKNVKVVLQGTVPSVATTENVTIIKISEAEGFSEVRTLKTITREIMNPALLDEQINDIKDEADAFKTKIDETAASGVTVTSALQKYNEAITAINQAKTLKATNIAQAQTEISKARAAVTDGGTQLEKSVAEYEIGLGNQILEDVDEMFLYFTQNRSMTISDSRLIPITTKYDLASSKLSDARTNLDQNQYLNAKSKAIEAQNIGKDAYDLSLALKDEIGEGFALPGINPFFLAILGIVIILVGVGFVVYKKFFRWDELG